MSALPDKVVECFNTGAIAPLTGLCSKWMTTYGYLFVAPTTPANAVDEGSLLTLIKAFRTVFPDLRLAAENIEESESGCTFKWRGTGTYTHPNDGNSIVTKLHGDGRIRQEKGKIKDLWFTTDDYNILAQIGRICAEPGQASGRAEEINGTALVAFVRAIETGAPLDDSWQKSDLNSLFKTFADLNKGFDTVDHCYAGRGQISALIQKIRQEFPLPIKVTTGDGISQGSTTTYRCRISGADNRKFNMTVSFSSDRAGVNFARVAIAPPGKLKEMFA